MGFHEMVKRASAFREVVENEVNFSELITQRGKQIVYPSIVLLFQTLDDLDVNYHFFKENRMYQGIIYKGSFDEPKEEFTTHKHDDLKAVLFEMIMHEGFKLIWNGKKNLWAIKKPDFTNGVTM